MTFGRFELQAGLGLSVLALVSPFMQQEVLSCYNF